MNPIVATRANLPHFEETLELGVALGLDGMMFNRFNPGGEGQAHLDLQASPAKLQAALDLAEEGVQRYDFPISCSIALPPCLIDTARYRRLTFGFCAAGTDRAYYTLDAVDAGRRRRCAEVCRGVLWLTVGDGSVSGGFQTSCPRIRSTPLTAWSSAGRVPA